MSLRALRPACAFFVAGALTAALAFAFVSFAHAECRQNELCNPLSREFSSIPGFIAGALRVLVIIALPIISLFIVYSGFLFILAQGNTGKLETAKKNFLYVIIGAILILGAWVIATLIGGTVSQLTSG